MKDVFEDLIQRYEEKRSARILSVNPQKFWLFEFFKPSKTPKAESIIDQELEFYREFEGDLVAIPKLKGKTVDIKDWREIAHFLKVHNERLASQIDNMSTNSAIFAMLAAVLAILADNVGAQNWIPFVFVTYASITNFFGKFEKRNELARNKELAAIIEYHIHKNV